MSEIPFLYEVEEEPDASIIVDDNALSVERSFHSSSRASEHSAIVLGSQRPSRSVSPIGGRSSGEDDDDAEEHGEEGDEYMGGDQLYEDQGDLDPMELAQMRIQLSIQEGDFSGEPENTLDRQYRALEMWQDSERNPPAVVGGAQVPSPMLPAQHDVIVHSQPAGAPDPATPPEGFEHMMPSTYQTVISGAESAQYGSAVSLGSDGGKGGIVKENPEFVEPSAPYGYDATQPASVGASVPIAIGAESSV